MNEHDLYYLRSILRQLRILSLSKPLTRDRRAADEVLASNIDWLGCFIEKWETAQEKQKRNFRVAMKRRVQSRV